MGTIRQLVKGVNKLNLSREVTDIIERTKQELIRLNLKQLFQEGQDSSGVPLKPYRSRSYAEFKATLNPQLGGMPDLKLTGGFYNGFEVEVTPKIFTIFSKDSKAPQLELRYGRYIFGINRANKLEYISFFFYPQLKTYITSNTGLVFR